MAIELIDKIKQKNNLNFKLLDSSDIDFTNDLNNVYDESKTYNINDIVNYKNELYKCLNNNVTSTWDSTKWLKINIIDLILRNPNIVPEYDKTQKYSVDNLVKYNGNYYLCKNTIESPHDWNSNEWLKIITDSIIVVLDENKDKRIAIGVDADASGDAGESSNTRYQSVAIGRRSKAVGASATAIGASAIAGNSDYPNNHFSVALGYKAAAIADSSVAIGGSSQYNTPQHAIEVPSLGNGVSTLAAGESAIAIGGSIARSQASIVIGKNAQTEKDDSNSSVIIGENATSGEKTPYSVAIGYNAKVISKESDRSQYLVGRSIAIGQYATASGMESIQIGPGTNETNNSLQFRSHNLFVDSDGSAKLGSGFPCEQSITDTNDKLPTSHAVKEYVVVSKGEGIGSTVQKTVNPWSTNECHAYGLQAHAEGHATIAGNVSKPSTAEDYNRGDQDSGYGAHSEGVGTTAKGKASHAEGDGTTASGYASHAGGRLSEAVGTNSIASGNSVKTSNDGEAAFGRYNTTGTGIVFSVGNGYEKDGKITRSNIITAYDDGTVAIAAAGLRHNGKNGWQYGVASPNALVGTTNISAESDRTVLPSRVGLRYIGGKVYKPNGSTLTIPAKTSDLTNDGDGTHNFATVDQIQQNISINSTDSDKSISIGLDSEASGDTGLGTGTIRQAIALGRRAKALGPATVAVGSTCVAGHTGKGAPHSVALGYRTAATADSAIAIGGSNQYDTSELHKNLTVEGMESGGISTLASGESSVAIGGSIARSSASIVIGKNAYTENNNSESSVVIGNNAKAKEKTPYSVAIGYNSEVYSKESDRTNEFVARSVAIGINAKSGAIECVQLGRGTNETNRSLQFRKANLFVEDNMDKSKTTAKAKLGSGFPYENSLTDSQVLLPTSHAVKEYINNEIKALKELIETQNIRIQALEEQLKNK